jgi:hypothetical protein
VKTKAERNAPMTQEERRQKNTERNRVWRAANPGRAREHHRRWRAAHPGTEKARAQEYYHANRTTRMALAKRWKATHRDSVRATHRKREYGLAPEQYQRMFAEQRGLCGICGMVPTPTVPLCVDHDHRTKNTRGLLCRKCNAALGLLGDDEEGVSKALEYLRRQYVSTHETIG